MNPCKTRFLNAAGAAWLLCACTAVLCACSSTPRAAADAGKSPADVAADVPPIGDVAAASDVAPDAATPADTAAELDAKTVTLGDLHAGAHPHVGLAAVVTFTTSEPTFGSVVVATDGAADWIAPAAEPTPVTAHTVVVRGLHADTNYDFRARALTGGKEKLGETTVPWHTDPLPADFPVFKVNVTDKAKMQPGLTLAALVRVDPGKGGSDSSFPPTLLAFDAAGAVVWYVRPSDFDRALGVNLIDGKIAVVGYDGISVFDLDWNLVKTLTPKQLGMDVLHHDIINLPGGHMLVVSVRVLPPQLVNGTNTCDVIDEVHEITADGVTVQKWAMDDFVPYKAGEISGDGFYDSLAPGCSTRDIYHVNSLNWSASDDTITVGLYMRGQVLRFKRSTGAFVWTIGKGGTMPLADGNAWFMATHGPYLRANGNLIVMDNGWVQNGGLKMTPSRAVEYSFDKDPAGKDLAHEVWSWKLAQVSPLEGNVQELANGNVFVCAGFEMQVPGDFESVRPHLAEVTHEATPQVVFDLVVEPSPGADPLPPFVVARAWRIDGL